MKKLVTAVALATLLASPAFAKSKTQASSNEDPAYAAFGADRSGAVVEDGKIIGRDPDPNIRVQLKREYPFLEGNGQ